MYYPIAALISALVGTIPCWFARRTSAVAIQGVLAFVVNWVLFYSAMATTVYPLFGMVGFVTILWLALSAGIASTNTARHNRKNDSWA